MKTGIVFSIEEFAVYDGPGPRVNVFLKGCPLRCQWCHNPEGWLVKPQIVKNGNGCIHCGVCESVCPSPSACTLCGKCAANCPRDLIRVSGKEYTSEALAKKLMEYKPMLNRCGGGITFSGGEILLQVEFLCEAIEKLEGINLCLETCGYGESNLFEKLIHKVDHVFYDLKIMDAEKHRYYTGKDNALILKNAELLKRSGVPFTIRIPLIRGVNCDKENMEAVVSFLADAKALREIELLPYNQFAGAKYSLVGLKYAHDDFRPPREDEMAELKHTAEKAGLKCRVRDKPNI